MKRTVTIAAGAGILSLIAHGTALVAFQETPEPFALESAPPGTARLGNAFADMVAGAPAAVDAPDVTDPTEAETTEPAEPTELAEATETVAAEETSAERIDAAQPGQTETASPDATAPVTPPDATETAEPIEAADPDTAPAASLPVEIETSTAENVLPVLPEGALAPAPTPAAPTETVEETPPETTPPVATAPAEPVEATPVSPVPETVEALPPDGSELAVLSAPPPPSRPEDLVPESERTPTPPPPQPAPPPRTAGNAAEDTRRGTDTGAESANDNSQGNGNAAAAAAAANARAAAQYGNAVMTKIARTRRERTQIRGVALVAFQIGSNGALVSVGIARSSGNPQLDQIAMNHIRRAGPFPPPPPGARTSFSVEFAGR
ncbi:TonB family protein [Psychromarinibacter sp. S121]|uniref:TonB family protein n=1 Tax=Psychromarinibacter sp. S121 TaxID=3415127 RepID=UPI003C7CFDBB